MTNQKKRIVLFGTGRCAQRAYDTLVSTHNITCIVDNNIRRQGELFCGHKVISPAEGLTTVLFDDVVICSMYTISIQTQLVSEFLIRCNQIKIAKLSKANEVFLRDADPAIDVSPDAVNIPIFHIASMARSGETLLLHRLNNHPDVRVSHNLNLHDSEEELRFFTFMMTYASKRITLHHPLLEPYKPDKKTVVMLKQGVWEHPWPFDGVILARNPLAIYASVLTYRDPEQKPGGLERPQRNAFIEWMERIAPREAERFKTLAPVDQFCEFYNRRMGQLYQDTKNRILHYETFVASPEDALHRVCKVAGLGRSPGIAQPTEASGRIIGHGGFKPSLPIGTASVDKYKQVLSEDEARYVWNKTKEVAACYGYRFGETGPLTVSTSRML